jgi:DNA-directed RNA polymerase subunit RPC12/RpoP
MRESTAKIVVRTACLECGRNFEDTLGNLSGNAEPACPACGGKLDPAPIQRQAEKMVRDFENLKKYDKTVRKLIEK